MTKKSKPKCPTCKKTVKNDDMTANCYKKCVKWCHGFCVSLKIDEVKWLGVSRRCVCLCDICISSNISTTDAKLTSVFESVENKVSTVLENAIPKAIEKVAEMETNSVAVPRSPLNVNKNNGNMNRYRETIVWNLKLLV